MNGKITGIGGRKALGKGKSSPEKEGLSANESVRKRGKRGAEQGNQEKDSTSWSARKGQSSVILWVTESAREKNSREPVAQRRKGGVKSAVC